MNDDPEVVLDAIVMLDMDSDCPIDNLKALGDVWAEELEDGGRVGVLLWQPDQFADIIQLVADLIEANERLRQTLGEVADDHATGMVAAVESWLAGDSHE